MPELPEVETTRRGLESHLVGRRIVELRVNDPRLRWPVASDLAEVVRGQRLIRLGRRGKYLLLHVETGCLIVHLGMSGSLRLTSGNEAPRKHDHVEILLDGGRVLRFHDPRRFGSFHHTHGDPLEHPLLRSLGVEPLGGHFTGAILKDAAGKRRSAVKSLIMDSRIVVGVGNIYASESLFLAGIHPARAAGRIALARYERLAGSIREVLEWAIRQGGTTLRDFVNGVGEPGYFAQELSVYGRSGEPCKQCGAGIRSSILGQRNTFYCVRCQR